MSYCQDFVEGRCGKTLMRGRSVTPAMKKARKLVWLALNRFRLVNLYYFDEFFVRNIFDFKSFSILKNLQEPKGSYEQSQI